MARSDRQRTHRTNSSVAMQAFGRRGLSRLEMALECEMSEGTLRRILNGTGATVRNLEAFARRCGLSAWHELLADDERAKLGLPVRPTAGPGDGTPEGPWRDPAKDRERVDVGVRDTPSGHQNVERLAKTLLEVLAQHDRKHVPDTGPATGGHAAPAPRNMMPFLKDLLSLLADVTIRDEYVKSAYDAAAPSGAAELTFGADMLPRAARSLASIRRDPALWPPPLLSFVRRILFVTAEQHVQKVHKWLDATLSLLARESAAETSTDPVRLSYQVQDNEKTRTKELPFVIGVLADLSGDAPRPKALREREFKRVDRTTFAKLLAEVRPHLHLSEVDFLSDPGAARSVDLTFEALEDFKPDRVVARAPAFAPLCAERQRLLAEKAPPTRQILAIEDQLTAQLRAILRHPAFRALEATWRGLHHLVGQIPAEPGDGSPLVVRVWNVSKAELVQDFRGADALPSSVLFKKVYDGEFGQAGGNPFGLLVGDFPVDNTDEDVELLEAIAGVAAAAHAPFIGSASANLFMLSGYAHPRFTRVLESGLAGSEYVKWLAFQKTENSQFVGLTLPGVLGRPPYGGADATRAFPFVEFGPDESPANYPWISSAWAYAGVIARSFLTTGWFNRIHAAEDQSKVEGLPPASPAGTGQSGCVEIPLDTHRGYLLAELGLLPLVCLDNDGGLAFYGNQSCHKPSHSSIEDRVKRLPWSKITNLLCLCRFSHYMKAICRDKAFSEDWVNHKQGSLGWLNDWLLQYVQPKTSSPDGVLKVHYPLLNARIGRGERKGFVAKADMAGYLPYEAVAAFFSIEAILSNEAGYSG